MQNDERAGTPWDIYRSGSFAGVVGNAAQKVGGFVVIWLLNRILSKTQYGEYAFAVTLVGLVAAVASGGLEHSVMYRLSRAEEEPGMLSGRRFVGEALTGGLLVSGLAAVGLYLLAGWISRIAGLEQGILWLTGLAFLLPLRAVQDILDYWYKARQLIVRAIYIRQVGVTVVRIVALTVTWLAWPTLPGAVAALVVAELIPVVWWLMESRPSLGLSGALDGWDWKYAGKTALTTGVSKTVKRTDILMVGLLASSAATAEYDVAAKLGGVALVGHNLLNTVLRPRAGSLLGSGSAREELETEYHRVRLASLLMAMIALLAVIVLGKPVLRLFGNYEAAYVVLLLVAAGRVLHCSFGMSGGLLTITGYAGTTLIITIGMLILNIALNWGLIPLLGAAGAALATLLTFAVSNSATAYSLLKLEGLRTYSGRLALVVGSVVAGGTAAWLLDWGIPGMTATGGLGLAVLLWLEQEHYLTLFRGLLASMGVTVDEGASR